MNQEQLSKAIFYMENPDSPHLSARLPESEWTELFGKIMACIQNQKKQEYLKCVQEYRHRALSLKPGDTICFGHYLLPSMIDPNPDHIWSPICWRVLEKSESRLRLLSEYSLFWGGFEGKDWKHSYLRRCLNEEKMEEWFTPEERSMMICARSDMQANPLASGEDRYDDYTFDHITLLSAEEVVKYFASYSVDDMEKHIVGDRLELQNDRAGTVRIDGEISEEDEEDEEEIVTELSPCSWWLRTNGRFMYSQAVVDYSGEYIDLSGRDGDEIDARPVIWIDLECLPPFENRSKKMPSPK